MSQSSKILIKVKVTPCARESKIEKVGPSEYKAFLHSPPTKGKANAELLRLVSSRFGIPPSRVMILKGEKSSLKMVVLEFEK